MARWFTSDLHLGHAAIMKYCERPFESADEMDTTIVNWLKTSIAPGDLLYILGDLTFEVDAAKWFFDEMKYCQIYYILGNHDHKNKKVIRVIEKECISVDDRKEIKVDKQKIVLDHFPMRSWPSSHHGSWQLYGHSHGCMSPIGLQMDVGVDTNHFKPYSFEEVKERMEAKEQLYIDHHAKEEDDI